MTTISSTGLQPIIRDRAGTVEPVPAVIAAMTGQPITEVVRVLRQCITDLKALAGVRAAVAVQDACHAALHRFGYNGHRLFADDRRHRALGELFTAYSNTPGESELLLALCEDGEALAFLGQQVSSRARSAPRGVNAAVLAGDVNMRTVVRFALTFRATRPAPIASPDHRFLETIAIPAFALAEAYGIEITPMGWPYWNVTFPEALIDGSPGNGEQVVCGEHELLEAVSGRVHLQQLACELTDQIVACLLARG